MKQLNIRIPEELHRKLRVYAAETDTDMQTVVAKALEEFFEKKKKK
jgi:predicted HicB family RNase H-like nuclease